MEGYQIRRIIIVVVAVLLLVLAVSQGAKIINNIAKDSNGAVQTASVTDIKEFASSDSYISLTFDSPILAQEDYRQIKITIASDSRMIEIMRGYDGQLITKKVFPNTVAAYENLLRAADYEGFDSSRSNNFGKDERGICPDGRRQVYEFFNNSQNVLKLWSASCSKKLGTFNGDSRKILELFQKQIPDYKVLVKDIKI